MEGVIVLLVVLGIPLYFLPSIIAFKRDHQQRVSIFALNFLLGWSLLGWVGSLVWSLAAGQERPQPPPAAPTAVKGAAVERLAAGPRPDAGAELDDSIDERAEDVVQDAAHIVSHAVENSRTRTIRWRDAGQLLDQDIRRRASRAGVINLAGDAVTAAIEQGLLMLLDRKAPDARVARTTQPLPVLETLDAADAEDEESQDQAAVQADTAITKTAATAEPGTDEQDPHLLENLEALIRMHERGVLTDAEMEAAKRRLLE